MNRTDREKLDAILAAYNEWLNGQEQEPFVVLTAIEGVILEDSRCEPDVVVEG